MAQCTTLMPASLPNPGYARLILFKWQVFHHNFMVKMGRRLPAFYDALSIPRDIMHTM